MGRKRKPLIEKSPVKLRRRMLSDGRESLYLDRTTCGKHEYELLKLYLLLETSTTAKRQNAQTLRKAEEILRQRTEALFVAKAGKTSRVSSSMLLSEWIQSTYKKHEQRGTRDLRNIDNVRNNLE